MAGANMEQQFEAYFQRADTDRDGKISGAEAVAFFQGSNLPKQVLAQIWMHADQSHTGFLSRPEFYNALKLVTVAQSKRQLTPDIVKAALQGPASAKIPAPQINLAAIAAQPPSSVSGPQPRPHMGGPASSSLTSQFGQTPSGTGLNPQFGQTPSSSGMRPQFGQTPQIGQTPSSLGINAQTGRTPSILGMNPQYGQAPSSTRLNQQFGQTPSQTVRPNLPMPLGAASHPQGAGGPNFGNMGASGLPNSTTDWLGGRTGAGSTGPPTQVLSRGASLPSQPVSSAQDPFSAFSAKDTKASVNRSASDPMFGGDMFSASQSSSQLVSSGPPSSSAVLPVSAGTQPSAKPDPFKVLQSTLLKPSTGDQPWQMEKPNQQPATQVSSSVSYPAAVPSTTKEEPQVSWPKMTRANIHKYHKVFMEVDSDRDGRITGEQARSLFLSWRLPIDVLKQVWDLSDQDSDSMLTLREFCIALYLMERYREGSTLPSTLPQSVMLDETLLALAGPPTAAYGRMGWGPATGLRPPQGLPGMQPPGLRPPGQTPDGFNQQNSHGTGLSNGDGNSLVSNDQDAPEPDRKVENKEKELLDSKEKLEFYRTKMQDLVLYKSRCDNRLNEITERALADKREAEMLAKKYEEKYNQVAEIASKLTIEEASFREVQGRKAELQQAIIRVEQGGSVDGILQVRADRVQSDLEELLKALSERCKKHGVDIKSAALVELPPGWQPGVPEIAAMWDEEWDKFEDEGFSHDVTVPGSATAAPIQQENLSPTHSFSADSASNADFSKGTSAFDTESAYARSEDESKSPRESPVRQTSFESPSKEYSDHFRKTSDGDAETHRSFDEPGWGSFDNNDDIDSVWGFNANKESDHRKPEEKYFFGATDFSASPDRNNSPQARTSFPSSNLFFEDSVPGSPLSRAGNSPPRYSTESRDLFADSFSRYDSFSAHDRGSSPKASFTRFDSVNSTRGFDHSSNYSFDGADPFGSTPFKVSSDSNSPKKSSDKWSAF